MISLEKIGGVEGIGQEINRRGFGTAVPTERAVERIKNMKLGRLLLTRCDEGQAIRDSGQADLVFMGLPAALRDSASHAEVSGLQEGPVKFTCQKRNVASILGLQLPLCLLQLLH